MLWNRKTLIYNSVKCKVCKSELDTYVSFKNPKSFSNGFDYVMEKPTDKIQDIMPIIKTETCMCYSNELGCTSCGEVLGSRIYIICMPCMYGRKYSGLCSLIPRKIILSKCIFI